ncbi:MAG: transcriptional regulator [Deltaproteobacteria bacterium]|nr:MAG: transcriptional regulator [Deltaproteobacteria bacterium]
MEPSEFATIRAKLGKTQKKISQLLGTSIKAVHSYEQGWRNIPPHVERQMFFLTYQSLVDRKKQLPCWKITDCPRSRRDRCPAREFKMDRLCWFICGTLCRGVVHQNWREKMAICRECEVFQPLLEIARPHE